MRAAPAVVSAVVLALGVVGCGGTESSLTRRQVEQKLTAAPAEGFKKLRTASCREQDTENEYRCDVTTEDGGDAVLLVVADGDDVRVDSARTK